MNECPFLNCDIDVISLCWNSFGWFLSGVGETDPQVEKILSESLVTSFTSALPPAENASPWPVGFSLPVLTLSSHLHAWVWDLILDSPDGRWRETDPSWENPHSKQFPWPRLEGMHSRISTVFSFSYKESQSLLRCHWLHLVSWVSPSPSEWSYMWLFNVL